MSITSEVCECADRGCVMHLTGPCCYGEATVSLYRVDMGDCNTEMRFCEGCAEDAWESGLFTDGSEDEGDDTSIFYAGKASDYAILAKLEGKVK